jgi:hypothetical protein
MPVSAPDYAGASLPNLVAELEDRLAGSAVAPRLTSDLAGAIPAAASYLVVLFDGLGSGQLGHPAAATLRARHVASLDAPIPTTTTVSLATIATGQPPAQHGLIGYQLYLPDLDRVVNTIKWTDLSGRRVDYDTEAMLPAPNLWERLSAAGVEPITVQPAQFANSALTRLLYRGCRFEGVETLDELVVASLQLATTPGRLVFTYLPQLDYAAHVHGQHHSEYDAAMTLIDTAWSMLCSRLPREVTMVGTADHGHADVPQDRQHRIAEADHADRVFYGDSRIMYVRGEVASLADRLSVDWWGLDRLRPLWGPGPDHPELAERAPDGALVAGPGTILLHRRSDDRLVGHHGGLSDAERRIPLLVATRDNEVRRRRPGARAALLW